MANKKVQIYAHGIDLLCVLLISSALMASARDFTLVAFPMAGPRALATLAHTHLKLYPLVFVTAHFFYVFLSLYGPLGKTLGLYLLGLQAISPSWQQCFKRATLAGLGPGVVLASPLLGLIIWPLSLWALDFLSGTSVSKEAPRPIPQWDAFKKSA